MDKKKETESGIKYDNRLLSIDEKRLLSRANWNLGFKELKDKL